jgi:hypothetical protein
MKLVIGLTAVFIVFVGLLPIFFDITPSKFTNLIGWCLAAYHFVGNASK